MAADKQTHERQRDADRIHHENRIAWLGSGDPMWVDGALVTKHDRLEMTASSVEALRLISLGMCVSSAEVFAHD